MKHKRVIYFILFISLTISNCTSLEEQYNSNLTESQLANKEDSADKLLINLKDAARNVYQNPFGEVFSLSEVTTDEVIFPTRGQNWFDNGIWQQLHQHRWTGDHTLVTGCFNDLNGIIFASTNILKFNPTIEQEAIARFYRALAMYWLLDFFDQVPYRDPGESTLLQARVRKGLVALDYIINEVMEIMPNLPSGNPTSPSTNAGKVLLMKCYLNRGVYLNRQSPSFDAVDMNKVIALADEIINTNKYAFSDNYFDNFAPDNGTKGKENIFTEESVSGAINIGLLYYMVFPLHYNTPPYGGVNGFTITPTLYDKFEELDKRKGQTYRTPNSPPNPGNRTNMGFLVGQQYNLFNDSPLNTDSGIPVIFTREVKSIETGKDLEVTGIRPQKYSIDYTNFPILNNDWAYFRLSDVLLMKAEAILRGGTPTPTGSFGSTALEIVNSIRVHPSRGASALSSINLPILLDERACELWMECWRRQDLIRFGKFLNPFYEKNDQSDVKYLLFAIPNQQIAINKNLSQNTGY